MVPHVFFTAVFIKTLKEQPALMKKIILPLFIMISSLSCSSTQVVKNDEPENFQAQPVSADFAGKIDSQILDQIRDFYHWKEEEILIINFKQPLSSCHFNNNKITTGGKKWWKNFYSKINTENALNIQVLANGERVRRKLDDIKYFDDKNDLLYNHFFRRKSSCFGVMVINEEGEYYQYNGHYSERQVSAFIENLKN